MGPGYRGYKTTVFGRIFTFGITLCQKSFKAPGRGENMQCPIVQPFFDEPTNTFSYVVRDPGSHACAIVDSVLDFDYAAGRTDVRSANAIIDYVRQNDLTVE
ncbi:MAG TPA: MBL fold metallo-hydrolase, partial [Marinobacter sp.]|nr:MBL fold metallo-hydrolase [Marinobacter sp.]